MWLILSGILPVLTIPVNSHLSNSISLFQPFTEIQAIIQADNSADIYHSFDNFVTELAQPISWVPLQLKITGNLFIDKYISIREHFKQLKFQSAKFPRILVIFGKSAASFLNHVSSRTFIISRDIFILVTASNVELTTILDGRYPNFFPKYAYLIQGEKLFTLLPYESSPPAVTTSHILKVPSVWKKVSRTMIRNNNSRSKFPGSYFILISNSLNLNLCADPGNLSPWNSSMSVRTLLLCELSTRQNLTLVSVPRYPFPSFQTGLLLRPYSACDLFLTGEDLEIGFLVPVHLAGLDFNFNGILGPIGLPVAIWTLGFAGIMILFFYTSLKFGSIVTEFSLNVYFSMETVLRPLLDQCQEKLGVKSDFFRIALAPWLFYCLIISETYRGELVSYLVRPEIVDGPETFR